MAENKIPRMRTIKEAARQMKEVDPGTALTEHAIRRMIWTNTIPYIRAGNKYLLNLDVLEQHLSGSPVEEETPLRRLI